MPSLCNAGYHYEVGAGIVGFRSSEGWLDSHSQLDRVVRRLNQILFRAKIPFRRLNGRVPEEQLNLLKLAATGTA